MWSGHVVLIPVGDAVACGTDRRWLASFRREEARQPPWALIRLLGRMSVQFFSMYSRQLAQRVRVVRDTLQSSGVGSLAVPAARQHLRRCARTGSDIGDTGAHQAAQSGRCGDFYALRR